jgi:RNA polymerase sigma factor (sigma-70 family)
MTPLLAQVRRGERAFERLYRRHARDVYRYALVLLRSPEDAEFVTQTTFLNAYRAFERGERPRNARAWLLALAHGVCRQRVGAPPVELDDDEADLLVPDPAVPTPTEIRHALAHLPFEQRAALVMRELEGRTYAEIGAVLDLPPPAVEVLLFEARRALRERLEGALTCHQAERAISLRIDGRLPRSERRALRAHLRECHDCEGFARSQRAQRSAWQALARVPLPPSLQTFFGPGGVLRNARDVAGGVAVGAVVKTLAVAAIGAAAVGLGYERGDSMPAASAPPATSAEVEAAPVVSTPAIRVAAPPRAVKPRARAARLVVSRPRAPRAAAQPPQTLLPSAAASSARPFQARTWPLPVPPTSSPAHAQTRAGPPPKAPASPPPGVQQQPPAPALPAAPAPTVALPELPPAPPLPLPLPLPEPPKLP